MVTLETDVFTSSPPQYFWKKLKKREPKKKKKKVTGWLEAYPFQQTLTAKKEKEIRI
jgi:hypothetical protein